MKLPKNLLSPKYKRNCMDWNFEEAGWRAYMLRIKKYEDNLLTTSLYRKKSASSVWLKAEPAAVREPFSGSMCNTVATTVKKQN